MVDAGRGEAAEVKESTDDIYTFAWAPVASIVCLGLKWKSNAAVWAAGWDACFHAPEVARGGQKFRFAPFHARSAGWSERLRSAAFKM